MSMFVGRKQMISVLLFPAVVDVVGGLRMDISDILKPKNSIGKSTFARQHLRPHQVNFLLNRSPLPSVEQVGVLPSASLPEWVRESYREEKNPHTRKAITLLSGEMPTDLAQLDRPQNAELLSTVSDYLSALVCPALGTAFVKGNASAREFIRELFKTHPLPEFFSDVPPQWEIDEQAEIDANPEETGSHFRRVVKWWIWTFARAGEDCPFDTQNFVSPSTSSTDHFLAWFNTILNAGIMRDLLTDQAWTRYKRNLFLSGVRSGYGDRPLQCFKLFVESNLFHRNIEAWSDKTFEDLMDILALSEGAPSPGAQALQKFQLLLKNNILQKLPSWPDTTADRFIYATVVEMDYEQLETLVRMSLLYNHGRRPDAVVWEELLDYHEANDPYAA